MDDGNPLNPPVIRFHDTHQIGGSESYTLTFSESDPENVRQTSERSATPGSIEEPSPQTLNRLSTGPVISILLYESGCLVAGCSSSEKKMQVEHEGWAATRIII